MNQFISGFKIEWGDVVNERYLPALVFMIFFRFLNSKIPQHLTAVLFYLNMKFVEEQKMEKSGY